jgi:hypothetical protein
VTGGTVNRAALRIALKVFHLCKLLVDHPMHGGHFTRGALRPFVVAGEVGFDVTVSAGYAETPAVTNIHDGQQQSGASIPKVLEILENFLRWLVFFSGDPLGPLFYVLSIHVRLARLGAKEHRQKSQGRDGCRALGLHESGVCMRCAKAAFRQRLRTLMKDRGAGLMPSECENGYPECGHFVATALFYAQRF